jgi:hypothetical protein|uniref:Uncharacterized protein n=1 Tax=Picea glauca TaxID=3330 RepID=A0A117NHA0_PICGL|nr:hypothetical protein ABT39_MTgene5047 [Picea glauca]
MLLPASNDHLLKIGIKIEGFRSIKILMEYQKHNIIMNIKSQGMPS